MPARPVGEGQEDAAAVALEPVELERPERERDAAEAAERRDRAGAAGDLAQLLLGRLDLREHAQRRVVREVVEAGAAGRRRLGMVAESSSRTARQRRHALLRVVRRAHLRVQLEDAPLPVQQLELAAQPASTASGRATGSSATGWVVLRSGTSRRSHARRNAAAEITEATTNTGWSDAANAPTYFS